jgi:hypothetical protein
MPLLCQNFLEKWQTLIRANYGLTYTVPQMPLLFQQLYNGVQEIERMLRWVKGISLIYIVGKEVASLAEAI